MLEILPGLSPGFFIARLRAERKAGHPCEPELQAFVRRLTIHALRLLFRLTWNLAQRPLGSSAFAAGQLKRQVTPEAG
jgi:hypothetical protein